MTYCSLKTTIKCDKTKKKEYNQFRGRKEGRKEVSKQASKEQARKEGRK